MENKNLFTKLAERFKQNKNITNSILKKRVMSLALASTLALSTLGLSACVVSTTPGGNGGNGGTTNGEYSKILQDILDSDYYDNVIQTYKDSISNTRLFSNLQSPIPYDFLQDQGHNIDDIKNNTLECRSVAYTKGDDTNTLYLSTRVENSASTPYYTCYVLKYTLTDQEYDDLYMLHNYEYIQAGLFIQELDNQKTPTVESKANVTIDTYDKMIERLEKINKNYDLFKSNVAIDVTKLINDKEIEINVRDGRSSSYDMIIHNEKLRTLKYKFYDSANSNINNNIFSVSDPSNCIFTNGEEFQNTYEAITHYDSQNGHELINLKDPTIK